jgi:hypothetical protein
MPCTRSLVPLTSLWFDQDVSIPAVTRAVWKLDGHNMERLPLSGAASRYQ